MNMEPHLVEPHGVEKAAEMALKLLCLRVLLWLKNAIVIHSVIRLKLLSQIYWSFSFHCHLDLYRLAFLD
jgi:hypothetical protein